MSQAHPGKALHAPTYLVANSADELHKLILENNLKWRREFQYFAIYAAGRKHYAWFYFDHSLLRETTRSDND